MARGASGTLQRDPRGEDQSADASSARAQSCTSVQPILVQIPPRSVASSGVSECSRHVYRSWPSLSCRLFNAATCVGVHGAITFVIRFLLAAHRFAQDTFLIVNPEAACLRLSLMNMARGAGENRAGSSTNLVVMRA